MFIALIFGGLFYTVTLGINYQWLAWLMVATFGAAFIVPALPGRPFFWEACAVAAWPSLIVHLALNRRRFSEIVFHRHHVGALACLAIYLGVLVLLMAVRGVGFRVLGGEQMGGRFYVQQLVLGVVPLLFWLAPWQRTSLLAAFFTGAAMSLTYVVSDFALVYGYGGRATEFLLYFLELPTDAVNFYLGFEQTGLRRFQSFAFVGSALFAVLLVLFPLRRVLTFRGFWVWPLLLGSLGLGLSSGHRTVLVQASVVFILLCVFNRLFTPLRLAIGTVVLCAGLAFVYHYAPDLPVGVQRSISVLPGIRVSQLAREDAYNTLRDRIEVLKLGVRDLPRYLWVGRGFGMDRIDKVPPGLPDDGIFESYRAGIFYNGTFGLLIKTGLVGFFAAFGFMVYTSREALWILRQVRAAAGEGDPDLFGRYCQFAVAKWFAIALFFVFLHGDAGIFLQQLVMPAGIVFACSRIWRLRTAAAATSTAPQDVPTQILPELRAHSQR